MADSDLQRIIDDLRKRREMLEIAIQESTHQTAERAKTLFDVDRLRERFGMRSGGDNAAPSQSESDQRD